MAPGELLPLHARPPRPDGLDSYATVPDDLTRAVPNPPKRNASKAVAEAKAAITSAEAGYGRAAKEGVVGKVAEAHAQLCNAIEGARQHLGTLEATARATPAKAPLGDSHPYARRIALGRHPHGHFTTPSRPLPDSSVHYARADHTSPGEQTRL